MIKYKERVDQLDPIYSFGEPYTTQSYDAWYSYLINDWIPRQPDADELMRLFIDCKFDPTPFILRLTDKL